MLNKVHTNKELVEGVARAREQKLGSTEGGCPELADTQREEE